jgi:transcriptional regulator with XRE-family HTH domain
MELSSELKRLRESRGLTLRELAEGTGISNAYLNQLENDRIKEPSPNIIAKISKFYGVSYQRLMKLAGYAVPGQSGNGTSQHGAAKIEGLKDLTSDDLDQVRDFVDFLRLKRMRRDK